jgi:hypothetical protein
VARVEVSVDGGASWRGAELEARTQWSWQRFRTRWRPERLGSHVLASRATDATGAVQPAADARNAVYEVAVEVGAMPPRDDDRSRV